MSGMNGEIKKWKVLTAAVAMAVGFWATPQGAGAATAVSGVGTASTFNLNKANASGTNSTAVGDSASASGEASISIGYKSNAPSEYAIALGEANAYTRYSFAVGNGATVGTEFRDDNKGLGGIAIGSATTTDGTTTGATVTGMYGVALGTSASVSAEKALALGFGASTSGASSVSIGDSASVSGAYAVALGSLATAGVSSVALGYNTKAYDGITIAIGYEANAGSDDPGNGVHALAIGYKAKATTSSSIAVGQESAVSGEYAIAIGLKPQATNEYSIALGAGAKALADDSISIGSLTSASGSSSIAIGNQSSASGDKSIVIGWGRDSGGSSSIVIGYWADAGLKGSGSAEQPSVGGIAIGSGVGDQSGATVYGDYGIAIGTHSRADVGISNSSGAVAIGYGAEASGESVAIGKGSVATGNEVSVGSPYETDGFTRKIVNVKAGSKTTDAANYGQLVDAQAVTTSSTTTYTPYEADSTGIVTVKTNDGGTAFTFKVGTGSTDSGSTDSGLVIGDKTNGWVDLSWNGAADSTSVTRGTNSTAYGYTANASGNCATALGYGAVSSGTSGIALGNARAYTHSSVAIGNSATVGTQSTPDSNGVGGIAIGQRAPLIGTSTYFSAANVNGDYGIAIGTAAAANGYSTVALGFGATSWQSGAISIGSSTAYGMMSIAIGDGGALLQTRAEGTSSIALGAYVEALGDYTTAINYGAKAYAEHSLAIGYKATVGYVTDVVDGKKIYSGVGGIAIGSQVESDGMDATSVRGNYGIAIGTGSIALDYAMALGYRAFAHSNAIALGEGAYGDESGSIAIGMSARARETDSIAIGHSAESATASSIAIGSDAFAGGDNAIAIGSKDTGGTSTFASWNSVSIGVRTSAAGSASTAISYGAWARPEYSVAIGYYAYVGRIDDEHGYANTGRSGVAIGNGARVTENYGISIGDGANVSGKGGTAIGAGAVVTQDGGVALGDANVTALNAVALGYGASATAANAVALGQDSVADTANTISVGAGNYTRKIVNVMAGSNATDAANYGQIVTGGSYNSSTGTLTFTNGAGTTAFTIDGFTGGGGGSGTTYIAGNGIVIDTTGETHTISAKVAEKGGLSVDANGLAVKVAEKGGLSLDETGLAVKVAEKGALSVNESGLSVKVAENGGLTVDDNGLAVQKDGQVAKDNTGIVTGGTVYNSMVTNGSYDSSTGKLTFTNGKGDTSFSVAINGSGVIYKGDDKTVTLSDNNEFSVKYDTTDFTVNDSGLAVKKDGKVESGNTGLVTGGTVYDAMKSMDNQVSQLSDDIQKVGAGAAALAALRPEAYDPNDKWSFAVGYGHYKGANAGALGAFFKPNEDTTVSLASTVGNGDPMVNMGLSFKLGNKGKQAGTYRSAVDLVQRIDALEAVVVKEAKRNDIQDSRLNAQERKIAQLQADIARMQQQIANLLSDSGRAIH